MGYTAYWYENIRIRSDIYDIIYQRGLFFGSPPDYFSHPRMQKSASVQKGDRDLSPFI